MLSDQLIPINQIAKIAKTDKIHLAYLTKLRLIPQTIRRKIDNAVTGCYPASVVPVIAQIEDLKNRGLSYSQIKYELHRDQPVPVQQNQTAFLIIGLILGYILFSINSIKTTSPETNPIVTTVTNPNEKQPIYLLAYPDKNFYKVGTTNFTSLIK